MKDERNIRCDGEELGPISIDKLYRMATRGEIDGTAEFWSDAQKKWLPIAGIIFDFEPPRLPQMRAAGIKKVRILGSGSNDCPVCAALQDKIMAIDSLPGLPPVECSCVPWCRLTIAAVA